MWHDYLDHYGDRALPLFIIQEDGRLVVVSAASPNEMDVQAGSTVISLIQPEKESEEKAS